MFALVNGVNRLLYLKVKCFRRKTDKMKKSMQDNNTSITTIQDILRVSFS